MSGSAAFKRNMNPTTYLCMVLLASFLGPFSVSAMSQENVVSDLKSDERIVFFTTDAQLSEDKQSWLVPIHAWVHELDNAAVRRAAIAAALSMKYGLITAPGTKTNFDRRIRLLVADNERGKQIVIDLAGKKFTLPRTEPNGHASATFRLDGDFVLQNARNGRLGFTAVLPQGDDRKFIGASNLVATTGISVISDFDDTVKMTYATDRTKMLDYALFRDYRAITGMPERYSSWAKQGVAFHFVSSSPWHLYEPIDEFLDKDAFPPRSLSLKDFRFKDITLLNLFRKGTETKPAQIVPIINAYPQRRFVLIGDSGQEDPEVYVDIMHKFPTQIERIYIHNVTNANSTDERFRKVFAGIDREKWALFDDPATLELPQ